ncbi:hypothetical protein B0181_11240 [Moraxella caviae]|uniref:(3S)-malyl-CoA thioesterase n=2 Tax=Moraxella caviae TaxID=34060 RepID=A0A1S9ZVR8_9GAMM|nr:CoA ester lyase [Moraxella caviae]OOR87071.1 hypothetical protein B0181_11240 [Moraxella caviae]STZ13812.1 (3S)-malyl-CoA thioesterase [Moraxella caviae]VEW10611.1 (3S)-malyl-CoA thioesterase [Moraxella caviae]
MRPITPQTFLFVPATRLDRVPKALASGAQAVIIDLEDAVAAEQKERVREQILAFDESCTHPYWLRINAATTADFTKDRLLIEKLSHVAGVFLPKCESRLAASVLHQSTQKPVIAMIESAKGLLNIAEIAAADGLLALSYGCLDFAHSLGVRVGSPAMRALSDKVRCELVLHSSAHGLAAPIETIYPQFDDDAGLAACVRHWQDFGFGGQLLIHPRQVGVVAKTLNLQDDLAFAQAVVKEFERTNEAAFTVAGRMVDLPVIRWAQTLVGKQPDK